MSWVIAGIGCGAVLYGIVSVMVMFNNAIIGVDRQWYHHHSNKKK